MIARKYDLTRQKVNIDQICTSSYCKCDKSACGFHNVAIQYESKFKCFFFFMLQQVSALHNATLQQVNIDQFQKKFV